MKKRSTRKSSTADLLLTPPRFGATPVLSPTESPKTFKFRSGCFTRPTNSSSFQKENRRSNSNTGNKPDAEPPSATSPAAKSRRTIADLKETASSHVDSIKRQIDCSYSDILEDLEVSYSRLHKRYKVLNQTYENTMNETEKEFNKMIDHIGETHDTMEVGFPVTEYTAAYMELIAEAQTRATRLCNTTIPDLRQSVVKAIDALRSHYGTSS